MTGRRLTVAAGVLVLAACAPEVDVASLPVLDSDFRTSPTWFRCRTTPAGGSTDIPGHRDSERIVYVNAAARAGDPGVTTGYPDGAVIAKDIIRNGKVDYTAVMRKIPASSRDSVDAELHLGWLFTDLDGGVVGGAESAPSSCYDSCHISAPYQLTWFDYREVADGSRNGCVTIP